MLATVISFCTGTVPAVVAASVCPLCARRTHCQYEVRRTTRGARSLGLALGQVKYSTVRTRTVPTLQYSTVRTSTASNVRSR
jgi:hypothetical protein